MLLFLLTAAAMGSAASGVLLADLPRLHRVLIPFSGGLLSGIALCWVLPDLASQYGWAFSIMGLLSGLLLLAMIDRFVVAVCPSCAPPHGHDHCATQLHGFGPPLLIAASLHSFFDGWSLVLASGMGTLGRAFGAGITVHKIPEAFALGLMARASFHRRRPALLGAMAVQSAMLFGGLAEQLAQPYLPAWLPLFLLALAGGSFLFLGLHATHTDAQQRGWTPALLTALLGLATSAVSAKWL